MSPVHLLLLLPMALAQFELDGMRPDVAFGDNNDHYDVAAMFNGQDKYFRLDQNSRRAWHPKFHPQRRSDNTNDLGGDEGWLEEVKSKPEKVQLRWKKTFMGPQNERTIQPESKEYLPDLPERPRKPKPYPSLQEIIAPDFAPTPDSAPAPAPAHHEHEITLKINMRLSANSSSAVITGINIGV